MKTKNYWREDKPTFEEAKKHNINPQNIIWGYVSEWMISLVSDQTVIHQVVLIDVSSEDSYLDSIAAFTQKTSEEDIVAWCPLNNNGDKVDWP